MIRRAVISGHALAFVIGLISLAASRVSASIIFDNIAINGGLSPDGSSPASQLDNGFGFDAGAADDFLLPTSSHISGDWLVSGVNWAGRFAGGGSVPIPAFNIIFWPRGNGDMPSGETPTGQPPDYSKALAIYRNVPAAETPDGVVIGAIDYTATLPSDFRAHANTRYWIEVQATVNYPPLWEFHATQLRQLSLPWVGYDLINTKFWSPPPGIGDLAFQLVGDPFPEPAAFMSFAILAVLACARRSQSNRLL